MQKTIFNILILLVLSSLLICCNRNNNDPGPAPAVHTVFSRTGNVLTLDLNTLPTSMRSAGFSASDNALWFAMANIYFHGPGPTIEDDNAGSMIPLNNLEVRTAIYNWFDGEVMAVRSTMIADPAVTLVAITNDGRDKLGFRLGPVIVSKLSEFGNRVSLGKVVQPEDY